MIIEELAKYQISVVEITDHHVIDVARITELQTLGDAQGITVLPGIEFLSDARGEEPIHFIAIFGRDLNLNFVWKQLEGNTDIKRIRSEEHTSELQSLMRISYAVFCLKKKTKQ